MMKPFKIIAAALLTLAAFTPAHASYDFVGGGGKMVGTLNTPLTLPITLGCFTKYGTHPVSVDWAFSLHKDAVTDEYINLSLPGTDDAFDARQDGPEGSAVARYTSGAGEYDGDWVPWVATFETTGIWNVFVELVTNTTEHDGGTFTPGAIGEIVVGLDPAGFSGWINKIAECAIWDGELSNANITAYLGGTCASNIASPVGYWPLDANNATQSNMGSDTAGDLTVTASSGSGVYAADHPTITCGGAIAPLAKEYIQRQVTP